ncbi:polysaccharide biosynthesis protein [Pseudomonas aeruginosa]
MFSSKKFLFAGVTGSFCDAVLNRFLDTDIAGIRIFSRYEQKEDDMRRCYGSGLVNFYFGAFRYFQCVVNTIRAVVFVSHAEALKQCP